MKKIAKEIANILDKENCKFVLIGALARDIFFEQKGIKLEVRTKDVDFAILVDDWAEFDKIKDKIKNELNGIQDTKVYRLIIEATPIDLLPFGKIEDGNSTIKWPNGFRERMKVMGFKEAYENAANIIIDGVSIKTIIPEMLIALKISSWSHGNRAKDALDMIYIFRNITALCNDLLNDDKLLNQKIEEKYENINQKALVRFGLRIGDLIQESKDLKMYIRNVLQSGYTISELIKDMNESQVPTDIQKKEIKYFLDPFMEGILFKIG